nr:hypothetical protein [Halomonas elongata]
MNELESITRTINGRLLFGTGQRHGIEALSKLSPMSPRPVSAAAR